MNTQPSPAQLRRQQYLYETGRAEKAPLLPKHLPPRRVGIQAVARPPVGIAEADGYRLGSHDIHTTPANYATGEEWIAWYRGWKRGQQERPK